MRTWFRSLFVSFLRNWLEEFWIFRRKSFYLLITASYVLLRKVTMALARKWFSASFKTASPNRFSVPIQSVLSLWVKWFTRITLSNRSSGWHSTERILLSVFLIWLLSVWHVSGIELQRVTNFGSVSDFSIGGKLCIENHSVLIPGKVFVIPKQLQICPLKIPY